MQKAPIFWITGIPASGKTTLAQRLVSHFRSQEQAAEVIDGDDVRKVVSADLGFSMADRLSNSRRIAWIARLLARNGVTAVVASVSPYLEGRAEARKDAQLEGVVFIEIYVNCSVAVARERDFKKVYSTQNDVTGLGAPYEAPMAAEVVIDTEFDGPDACLDQVLKALPRLATTAP